MTSRSAFGYGKGCSSTAFMKLNISVLTPMPATGVRPPLPPLVRVPAAPANIVADRRGDTVDIEFSAAQGANDFERVVIDRGELTLHLDRAALGFKFQELYPDQNTANRFPTFNCGIGSCNFSPFQANWRSEGKTYAFTDNLTHNMGAHTLKGVAGNVGAKSVHSVAAVLEKVIRGKVPAAEVESAKQQVAAALDPLIAGLNAGLGSPAAKPAGP
jgi:hypothetical protein